MKLLYLHIFCLITTVGVAQTTFNVRFDAMGNELGGNATSIWPLNGHYYVYAQARHPTNPQNGYLWLGKVSESGALIDERQYYPDSVRIQAGFASSLRCTSNGNLVGCFRKKIFPPDEDVISINCIAKFNEELDTLWTCESPGAPGTFQNITAVCETSEGDFMACGLNDDNNFIAHQCGHIMKCDNEGDFLWMKTYCQQDYATGFASISPTDDGGAIIGGLVTWHPWINENDDKIIMRIDAEGNEVWRTVIENDTDTDAAYVQMSQDGNVLVSTIDEIENTQTFETIVVIHKYNSEDGELIWAKTVGEEGDAYVVRRIAETTNGDLVICGPEVLPLPGDQFTPAFYGYIIRTDSEGELLWKRHYAFETGTDSEFRDVQPTPDGGLIATGHADPNDDHVSADVWVVKTDEHGCVVPGCHTGIEEQGVSVQFRLYPNPASDILNVYLATDAAFNVGELTLTDLQGRDVKHVSQAAGNVTYMFNVEDLPAGVYVLTYRSGRMVISEKVMIE